MLAGSNQWNKQIAGTFTAEQARVSKIQRKLRKEIDKLRLQRTQELEFNDAVVMRTEEFDLEEYA